MLRKESDILSSIYNNIMNDVGHSTHHFDQDYNFLQQYPALWIFWDADVGTKSMLRKASRHYKRANRACTIHNHPSLTSIETFAYRVNKLNELGLIHILNHQYSNSRERVTIEATNVGYYLYHSKFFKGDISSFEYLRYLKRFNPSANLDYYINLLKRQSKYENKVYNIEKQEEKKDAEDEAWHNEYD